MDMKLNVKATVKRIDYLENFKSKVSQTLDELSISRTWFLSRFTKVRMFWGLEIYLELWVAPLEVMMR